MSDDILGETIQAHGSDGNVPNVCCKEILLLSFAKAIHNYHMTEEHFPYALQHMDVFARIAKWAIQLQEFDYTFKVEDST